MATAGGQVQGVLEVAAGYTDNVRSAPEDPVSDAVVPKSGDGLALISPGVVYATITPEQTHRLSYALTANLFLTTPEANTYANRLDWVGFFDLTPFSDLTLGASAAQTQNHTSNTALDSTATALRALLPGTGSFFVARLDESSSHEVSRDWFLSQSTGGAARAPLFGDGGTTTFESTNRVAVERRWRSDALGPEIRADYTYITNAVDADGNPTGDQKQLMTSAHLRWRRDWGRYFYSHLHGGASRIDILSENARLYYPTGGASLGYVRVDGTAELAYRRAIQTNLFLGQTYLIDEIVLRGALPVDEDERIWIVSSAGYQRGGLFEPSGDLLTKVDVALADVSTTWRVHDQVALSARYQFTWQDSNATEPPLPLSYTRHAALLGARFTVPRDEEVPRAYRRPERVDRADQLGGGLADESRGGNAAQPP